MAASGHAISALRSGNDTMASDTFSSRVHSSDADTSSRRRLAIGFLNWAHALDHYVILIFPTVVIGLEAVYGRSYSDLIALSTASFVAFGLFSLPAGWLADRWSRRNMMAAFYFGCGAVAARRRARAVAVDARGRAVRARHVRGDLSSGRHGDADRERHPARPLAGVQRRLRQSRRLARGRHYRNPDRRVLAGAAPSSCRA